MSVEPLKQPNTTRSTGARSDVRFPANTLKDCVSVADAIHKKGGGSASQDHLIAFLGYKSSNGAYLAKVGAAKIYGLITKSGNVFVPTALAHRIISPIYPDDAKRALVDAFFNVTLFKQIYEDFKGREIPPEAGLKNAMRNNYGVLDTRVDLAYRTFMESAECAGFFATRGSRSHLVIPAFSAQSQVPPFNQERDSDDGQGNDESDFGGGGDGGGGGGGGNGGGGDNNAQRLPPSMQLQDVKAKYLSSLITIFETKSNKGELDEKLMERIERLLEGN